ncbi:Short-chain dehydrogenase/reductase SDR [Plautia stali symbiont]|nr:Short-chain dehydrogenase/reductase SDR [Plautia stali symbiont]
MSHKIALITGGNRGLGKNGALKLAAKGVDILFTWRGHAEEAQAVVKEIEALGARAVALQLDVGDSKQFDDFAARVKATLN